MKQHPDLMPTPGLLERTPLLQPDWVPMLRRLEEHPHAPRWTHKAGDRLRHADLNYLRSFHEDLHTLRRAREKGPSSHILQWVEQRIATVPWFRRSIPAGLDLAREWESIPASSREEIARSPELLVPENANLDEMIVYRTAGTTGHALLVPHAARSAAAYQPLLEYALMRHGVQLSLDFTEVACLLVGAQASTVTFPTVLSYWNGAGFAKININPREWSKPESAARFVEDLNPAFLTGDPLSYAEMLQRGVPVKTGALVSTAVAMSIGLKQKLTKHYGCPVIDWYSLTETGPIGYACPAGEGYHLLPHDLHIEAVDPQGNIVADNCRGEICVTGGRNPFLPLLRYRTGDWGRISFDRCVCGDPMPRLLDLEGREPTLFRTADGSVVNPVDISRILREFPLVQHEFVQLRNLSCELTIRPLKGSPANLPESVKGAMEKLFGATVQVHVHCNEHLGSRPAGKVVPYRSEMPLED